MPYLKDAASNIDLERMLRDTAQDPGESPPCHTHCNRVDFRQMTKGRSLWIVNLKASQLQSRPFPKIDDGSTLDMNCTAQLATEKVGESGGRGERLKPDRQRDPDPNGQ